MIKLSERTDLSKSYAWDSLFRLLGLDHFECNHLQKRNNLLDTIFYYFWLLDIQIVAFFNILTVNVHLNIKGLKNTTYLICLLIDGLVDNAVGSLTDFLQDVKAFIDVVIWFDQTCLRWLDIIINLIDRMFVMMVLRVSRVNTSTCIIHDNVCITLMEPAILIIVNDIGHISQWAIWLFKMVVSLCLVHYVSGLTAHKFNYTNDLTESLKLI